MLYLLLGTDKTKAREAARKLGKGAEELRINDASGVQDLEAALRGGGLFGSKHLVLLEGILANEDMRVFLERSIDVLGDSPDTFCVLEDKLDAATRKRFEKYTQKTEVFDLPMNKAAHDDNFFALANALRAGSKKDLWLVLERELLGGKAPEMLHGSLFWAAKQMVLKPRKAADRERGKRLVEALAALPHEARRRGEELDYALERFALSGI